MAELEFSVLARQCLDRRIANTDALGIQISAWTAARTATHATLSWRFTTSDARIKLSRLFPA